jgi:hypothetical protein
VDASRFLSPGFSLSFGGKLVCKVAAVVFRETAVELLGQLAAGGEANLFTVNEV